MIQAFAPRLPRGFSRVMLAISAAVCCGSAFGQDNPPSKAAAKAADEKPAVAPIAPMVEAPDADAKVERFIDPNAKAALAIFKQQNYFGVQIKSAGPGNALTRLQNMASNVESEDPKLINGYIEFFAAELTKRDNINALIAPPAGMGPNAPQARALERAVDALTRPIIDARANKNPRFLTTYTQALFESSLPKLMDNNYLTRIDAMIVLGMAGGTSLPALDFYSSQLKIPDQIIWVKMWAAKGYTNASQSGRVNLDTVRSLAGADALITFLNSDRKLPYFAQFRAMEALGSLRVANINRPELKLDVASVVAGFLVDPSIRIETRAWAAWALGMMRVPAQVAPYNFTLAGYEVGDLASQIGTKIVAEYDDNADNFNDPKRDQAKNLTALLMFQVLPAIAGEEGVPDSGLARSNHPSISSAKSFLQKVDEKVKATSLEAYELLRAGGAGQKTKRDDLAAKVKDLKAFLDQNQPRERSLVPNGPVLPVGAAQVAAKPNGA